MRKLVIVLVIIVMICCAGCIHIVPTGQSATPEPSGQQSQLQTQAATLQPSQPQTPQPTAQPSQSQTPQPTQPQPQPLMVIEMYIQYSNADIDVDITYPEISGMQDATLQSNVNTNIHDGLATIAAETESAAQSDPAPVGKYFVNVHFDVMRNDGVFLSICEEVEEFTGGAHSAISCIFINLLNTQPGQSVAFEELFTSGADYMTPVNSAINAIIAADPHGSDYTFSTVAADQWYYLTDTELVVVFESYSIAPGAAGMPEFRIPLADLNAVLIPPLRN